MGVHAGKVSNAALAMSEIWDLGPTSAPQPGLLLASTEASITDCISDVPCSSGRISQSICLHITVSQVRAETCARLHLPVHRHFLGPCILAWAHLRCRTLLSSTRWVDIDRVAPRLRALSCHRVSDHAGARPLLAPLIELAVCQCFLALIVCSSTPHFCGQRADHVYTPL